MRLPKISWKKLMGRDERNEEKIEAKREEAHSIKNAITKDVLKIQKKVDKINKATNIKLNEISVDLKTVTYNIAIATGAKKRGLK